MDSSCPSGKEIVFRITATAESLLLVLTKKKKGRCDIVMLTDLKICHNFTMHVKNAQLTRVEL